MTTSDKNQPILDTEFRQTLELLEKVDALNDRGLRELQLTKKLQNPSYQGSDLIPYMQEIDINLGNLFTTLDRQKPDGSNLKKALELLKSDPSSLLEQVNNSIIAVGSRSSALGAKDIIRLVNSHAQTIVAELNG